jgi:zinc protease
MLDRTIAPAFIEPKNFTLPEPEIVNLANGSRFFFLEAGNQPVIKLEFVFKAGSWFETTPGIGFFAGKMLTEGTSSFQSKDIAETLDQYGAFVEINPGFDYSILTIHITTSHFERIESILTDILFYPTFPGHELELMKQIQIQQLLVNEQKNKFVAARLFRSNLYGNFPYGHVMTEENIKSISIDDLTNHFELWMNGKFDLFLTGKFDDAFQDRILQLFGDKLAQTKDFEKKAFRDQKVFDRYTEKADSLQSAIFMGKRCINKHHEKYSGTLLLNEVFGGYFGSRLMQNIREDKGYTYGISSHFVTLKNDAYFVINSDVKKEFREHTVEEILKEIEKLKTELISPNELYQVKNYLKGSMLNSMTSPFALTEKLKNIYLYDLKDDFYKKLFYQIDQTTSEDLLILANELLFDQPLSSIIIG